MDITPWLQKAPLGQVTGLAIIAIAGPIDVAQFHAIREGLGHTATDFDFYSITRSFLVRESLIGGWEIWATFRKTVADYWQQTNEKSFIAIHRFLAEGLEMDDCPSITSTVQNRINFSHWLRHAALSGQDVLGEATKAFKNAKQQNWTGDCMAIVNILDEAEIEHDLYVPVRLL
jgi:hypothetical protein